MDQSLSLPSFNIPKIKRQTSKDNLRSVNIASRDAQEILQTITRSFLDHTYKGVWQVTSTHLVQNKELEETYRAKRAQLKDEGRQARELTEQYAFLLVKDQNLIPKVSKIGLKTRYFPYNALGDSKFGIYVCRHADVQFRLADSWQIENFALIVFKVTLGRCKALNSQSSDVSIEPTPNFDCHVHQYPAHSSNSDKMQLVRSQVYLYEYNEDAEPSDRPRHCLPTAVIQYQKSFGTGDDVSIYTPKMQTLYNTPKGSIEITPAVRRGDKHGRSFSQEQEAGPPTVSKPWNKDPRKQNKGSSQNRSQIFAPGSQPWMADSASLPIQDPNMSGQQSGIVSSEWTYGSVDPNLMYQQEWSNNPNANYFVQPEAGSWSGQVEQAVGVQGAWQGQNPQQMQQHSVIGQDVWQGQIQQQIQQQAVIGQTVWPDQSEQQVQQSGIAPTVWSDQISQQTPGSWTGDQIPVGSKTDKEALQKLKTERRDPRLRGRKCDALSTPQGNSPSLTPLDDGNQNMYTADQTSTQSYNPTFGPVQHDFGSTSKQGMFAAEATSQAESYYNNHNTNDSLKLQNLSEQEKAQMIQGNMQLPQQLPNVGMPFVDQNIKPDPWSHPAAKQISMYEDSPQFSPVSDSDVVNEPSREEVVTQSIDDTKENLKSQMYTTEKTGLYPRTAPSKTTSLANSQTIGATVSKTTKKARTQISLEAYKARRVKVEEPKLESEKDSQSPNLEQGTYKPEDMEIDSPAYEGANDGTTESIETDNTMETVLFPIDSTHISADGPKWNSGRESYEVGTAVSSTPSAFPDSGTMGNIDNSQAVQTSENIYSTARDKVPNDIYSTSSNVVTKPENLQRDFGNQLPIPGRIQPSSETKTSTEKLEGSPAAPNLQFLMSSVNLNLPDLKNILEKIKQTPTPTAVTQAGSVKVDDVIAPSTNDTTTTKNNVWQPGLSGNETEPTKNNVWQPGLSGNETEPTKNNAWQPGLSGNNVNPKENTIWLPGLSGNDTQTTENKSWTSNLQESKRKHEDISNQWQGQWNQQGFADQWNPNTQQYNVDNNIPKPQGSFIGEDGNRKLEISQNERGSNWRGNESHDRSNEWASQSSVGNRNSEWRPPDMTMKHKRDNEEDSNWKSQESKWDGDNSWRAQGSKHDGDSDWWGAENDQHSNSSKSNRGGEWRSHGSRRERDNDSRSYGSHYDRESDRRSRGSQHNKDDDRRDSGSRYDRDSDRRSHRDRDRDRDSDWRSPRKQYERDSNRSHRSNREKDWQSHGSQYDRDDERKSSRSQYDRDDDRKSYGSHDRENERSSGSNYGRDDDSRSHKSEHDRANDKKSHELAKCDKESDRMAHDKERNPPTVHEAEDRELPAQDADQKNKEHEDERRKQQVSYNDLSQWKPSQATVDENSNDSWSGQKKAEEMDRQQKSEFSVNTPGLRNILDKFKQFIPSAGPSMAQASSQPAFSINTPHVQNILEKCKQITQGTGPMAGGGMNPYDMYSQSNAYGMQGMGPGYRNPQSNYPYDPMSSFGDVDYRQQGQMMGGGQSPMDMDYRQHVQQQQMLSSQFGQVKDEKADEARREQRRKNRKSRWGAPVMTPADLAQSKPVFSTDMIHNPILHVLNQTKVYMEWQKALEAEQEAKQKREKTRLSSQSRRRRDNKGSRFNQPGKDTMLGESDSDLSNISCEGSYVSDLDNMHDLSQYYRTEDVNTKTGENSGQHTQSLEDGKNTSGRNKQAKKPKLKKDMIGYTKRRKKRGRKAASNSTGTKGDDNNTDNESVSVSGSVGSELAVRAVTTDKVDSQCIEWAPQPIEAFGLKSWHEAIPDPRFQPCIRLDNCQDKIEDLLQNLKYSSAEKNNEEALSALEKDFNKTVTSHTEAKKKYIIVKEEKDDGTFVITAKTVDDEPLNETPAKSQAEKLEGDEEEEISTPPAKISKMEEQNIFDIDAIRRMAQERKELKKVKLQQENQSDSASVELPIVTDTPLVTSASMKREFDIFNTESYSQPPQSDTTDSLAENIPGLGSSDMVESVTKDEQSTKEPEPEKPVVRKTSVDDELICDDVSRPVKHLFTEKDFTKAKIVLKLKSKPLPVVLTSPNVTESESYSGSQISVIGRGSYSGMTSGAVDESQGKRISSLVSRKTDPSEVSVSQILSLAASSVQSRDSNFVSKQPIVSAAEQPTLPVQGHASRPPPVVSSAPIPPLNQPQANQQQQFLSAEKDGTQNIQIRDASPVPNVAVSKITNITGPAIAASTVHLPQPPLQNMQQLIPGMPMQQQNHPIARMAPSQSNIPISQMLPKNHANALHNAQSPVPVLTSSSFPPPPIHSGPLAHSTSSVPSVHVAQPSLASIRGPLTSSHLLPPVPSNLQTQVQPTATHQPSVPNIIVPPPARPNVRLTQPPPGQNIRVPPPALPNVSGQVRVPGQVSVPVPVPAPNLKVPPPNFNAATQVPNTQSFHSIPSHQNTTPAIRAQQTLSGISSHSPSIPTTLSTSHPPPGIQMMVRERPPMPTPPPNLPPRHPTYIGRPPFPHGSLPPSHRPPMPPYPQQHNIQGQRIQPVYNAGGMSHGSYGNNLRQIPMVTSSAGRAPSRSCQKDTSHVMDWFADKFAPKKPADTGGGESFTKQETVNQPSADLWKIAFDNRYSSGRSGEASQGNQADHFLGDSCQHHHRAGAANTETENNSNDLATEMGKTVEESGNGDSELSLKVAVTQSPLSEGEYDSLQPCGRKDEQSRISSQSCSNTRRQDVSQSHSNTPARSESRSRSISETRTKLDDFDKSVSLTEKYTSPKLKQMDTEEAKPKPDKQFPSRSPSTPRSKSHHRRKSRSRSKSRSSHRKKSRSYRRKSGSKSFSRKSRSRSVSRSYSRSRSRSYSRMSRSRSRSHRRRSRSRSWSKSYRRSRSRSRSKKSRSHRKNNKSHYRRSRSHSPYRRNSGSRSKKIYRRNSRSGSDSRRKTRSRTRSRSRSRSRSNPKAEKSKQYSDSSIDHKAQKTIEEFTSRLQTSASNEQLEKTGSDLEEGEVLEDSNDSENLLQSGNSKISLTNKNNVEFPAISTQSQNMLRDKKQIIASETETKEAWKSNRIKSVGIAWSQMLNKKEKNTESFYMEQHHTMYKNKKVKPKVTQEESSESEIDDDSISGYSQHDSDEEPVQSYIFRNEQKNVVKLTLADWLKKELRRDEVNSLQKFILYPLSLDLTVIEKVKRRKIKRKVRKELEAQFFTFRRACSPTEEREMSKGQIKQELAIVRQNLERVRGTPGIIQDSTSDSAIESNKAGFTSMNWIKSVSVSKSFADATCLTVSQDYQLRIALQEIESDMLLCAKNVATHGKPHCKVPDEILLKEERDTYFTKDGVFLILLHVISDKPYKRLVDMRKTLEQLKYELFEASQRNDKKSIKSFKDQKNTINVQRRTLLLSFTGSLTRKRLKKLAITKEHYTLCYNHLKEPLEDELGIKLGFIKTMLENIKSHFFIVQKEVV